MGQEQADLIQVEIENMLKKGAIQQTEHQVGKILSNIFLVGKRDEGNRPVVNLRYLNQFIPYQRQNGKFSLPPRITARERLHAQAGYERCLFFSSILSVTKELCSVFMVRESLVISLLMFRLGTSPQNHHKVAKNTSVCSQEDKYSDSNIFGQYPYHTSKFGRNYYVQRH